MSKKRTKEFDQLPMFFRKDDGTKPTDRELLDLTELINKEYDPKAEFFKAWKEKRDGKQRQD